jgi:hypothetical protein
VTRRRIARRWIARRRVAVVGAVMLALLVPSANGNPFLAFAADGPGPHGPAQEGGSAKGRAPKFLILMSPWTQPTAISTSFQKTGNLLFRRTRIGTEPG